jgi:hypothetical protein
MAQRLYAFTLANRLKLASIPAGGGTADRLSIRMSADLVLDGTEQVIQFDPSQSVGAGMTVNAGGSITANIDGHYNGDLGLHIDKSGGGGVQLVIWVEIKPIATGAWELASDSSTNPLVFDDGGHSIAFPGHIEALAGDEIRVKIKRLSGTAKLTTDSNVVGLGTVSDWAASLSVDRTGPA